MYPRAWWPGFVFYCPPMAESGWKVAGRRGGCDLVESTLSSTACHLAHSSLPQGTWWVMAGRQRDSFLSSLSLGTGCGETRGRMRSWVSTLTFPVPDLSSVPCGTTAPIASSCPQRRKAGPTNRCAPTPTPPFMDSLVPCPPAEVHRKTSDLRASPGTTRNVKILSEKRWAIAFEMQTGGILGLGAYGPQEAMFSGVCAGALLCALSLAPLAPLAPFECVSGERLSWVSLLPGHISCPLLFLGLKDYSFLSPLSHPTPVLG